METSRTSGLLVCAESKAFSPDVSEKLEFPRLTIAAGAVRSGNPSDSDESLPSSPPGDPSLPSPPSVMSVMRIDMPL